MKMSSGCFLNYSTVALSPQLLLLLHCCVILLLSPRWVGVGPCWQRCDSDFCHNPQEITRMEPPWKLLVWECVSLCEREISSDEPDWRWVVPTCSLL